MPQKPLPLPSAEVLRESFILTDEGRLINKIARTSRKIGSYADGSFRGGYRTVYVAGKLQFSHRVIWKMVHGYDPEYLDHIDRDITNNKPDNLRDSSHSQNMCNKKLYKNNTSGAKGIHRRKDNGMWRALISCNGKRLNIGQFSSFADAMVEVERARKNLHGQFARTQ